MSANLDLNRHDERDPNPWLAMYLDSSIPINEMTKEALMKDNGSASRRYLLPLIVLWSKLHMFFIHLFKFFYLILNVIRDHIELFISFRFENGI